MRDVLSFLFHVSVVQGSGSGLGTLLLVLVMTLCKLVGGFCFSCQKPFAKLYPGCSNSECTTRNIETSLGLLNP